jgi:hypothetical protein
MDCTLWRQTMKHCTSDSLLAFCLNISLAKNYCGHCIWVLGKFQVSNSFLCSLLTRRRVKLRWISNKRRKLDNLIRISNVYSLICMKIVMLFQYKISSYVLNWCKTEGHLTAHLLGLERSRISAPSQKKVTILSFSKLFLCEKKVDVMVAWRHRTLVKWLPHAILFLCIASLQL